MELKLRILRESTLRSFRSSGLLLGDTAVSLVSLEASLRTGRLFRFHLRANRGEMLGKVIQLVPLKC